MFNKPDKDQRSDKSSEIVVLPSIEMKQNHPLKTPIQSRQLPAHLIYN
jgi:hypothetical protein